MRFDEYPYGSISGVYDRLAAIYSCGQIGAYGVGCSHVPRQPYPQQLHEADRAHYAVRQGHGPKEPWAGRD